MSICLDGYPERLEYASAAQGRVTLSPIGSFITLEEEARALSIRYEDCQPAEEFIKEMTRWETIWEAINKSLLVYPIGKNYQKLIEISFEVFQSMANYLAKYKLLNLR